MKTILLTILEVGYKAVLYAAPACAALLFICVSAASVPGAHVHTAVTS